MWSNVLQLEHQHSNLARSRTHLAHTYSIDTNRRSISRTCARSLAANNVLITGQLGGGHDSRNSNQSREHCQDGSFSGSMCVCGCARDRCTKMRISVVCSGIWIRLLPTRSASDVPLIDARILMNFMKPCSVSCIEGNSNNCERARLKCSLCSQLLSCVCVLDWMLERVPE